MNEFDIITTLALSEPRQPLAVIYCEVAINAANHQIQTADSLVFPQFGARVEVYPANATIVQTSADMLLLDVLADDNDVPERLGAGGLEAPELAVLVALWTSLRSPILTGHASFGGDIAFFAIHADEMLRSCRKKKELDIEGRYEAFPQKIFILRLLVKFLFFFHR